MGLPWWLSGKESACNAGATGDVGSIPGSGRSPGGGQPTPVFLPGKSHEQRGAPRATVHGVAKSQTQLKQLSTAHLIKNSTETLWGFPGGTVVRN